MTDTIPNVPRELLERVLYLMDNYIGTTHPEEDEIRAILSAPSPAGVDGLEVVGYFFQHEETGNVMSVDAQQVDCGFEANNPRLHRVCALADYDKAQAIIDGLRGENERIRLNIAEYNESIACYRSERDQQAQRIGELEAVMRATGEAGRQLSNAAYNLAQREGHELTKYERALLSSLRKQWDAALSSGKEGE